MIKTLSLKVDNINKGSTEKVILAKKNKHIVSILERDSRQFAEHIRAFGKNWIAYKKERCKETKGGYHI